LAKEIEVSDSHILEVGSLDGHKFFEVFRNDVFVMRYVKILLHFLGLVYEANKRACAGNLTCVHSRHLFQYFLHELLS